jgi:flavoprotein
MIRIVAPQTGQASGKVSYDCRDARRTDAAALTGEGDQKIMPALVAVGADENREIKNTTALGYKRDYQRCPCNTCPERLEGVMHRANARNLGTAEQLLQVVIIPTRFQALIFHAQFCGPILF